MAVEDPKAAGGGAIFLKATWLPTRFSLAVTDGAGTWVADASDTEVRLRAEQWDQPVADYLALAERYLAFHQPSSTYSFHDAGNGHRRDRPTELFDEGSDKDASVNDEPSETGGGDPHSSPEKSGATSRGRRGRKRTRK